MKYKSTKTYCHNVGLSCAFRQWRAKSHCKFLHGYALEVSFEFESDELDITNWVVDFGGLKWLKKYLEDTFDHKTLVAEDDPELEAFKALELLGMIDMVVIPATGCEKFAEMIYNKVEQWVTEQYQGRVRLNSVEVREHGANSAIVERD